MLRHVRSIGLVALSVFVVLAPLCVAAGVDYIGITLALPLGRIPFMMGVDVGTRTPFGWATVSLLLTPDGKTLLLGGLEIRIADQEGLGSSLLRATVGMSYFDLAASFPSLVIGGGISHRFSLESSFQFGIRGEIIYPLALGPPLVSLGGGWAP